MERIFDGEIYDLICQNGNLVFTYCKSSTENAVLVGYKMITKDNKIPTDVAKNIFQNSEVITGMPANFRQIMFSQKPPSFLREFYALSPIRVTPILSTRRDFRFGAGI